jgi:hypothetical protein
MGTGRWFTAGIVMGEEDCDSIGRPRETNLGRIRLYSEDQRMYSDVGAISLFWRASA